MKVEAVDSNYSLINPCPYRKTSEAIWHRRKEMENSRTEARPSRTPAKTPNINTEGSVSLALEGGKGTSEVYVILSVHILKESAHFKIFTAHLCIAAYRAC